MSLNLSVEKKCSRCQRTRPVEVATVEAATAAETQANERAAKAAEITAYLAAIPVELMPDAIAYVKGQPAAHVHVYLCNPAEGRNCLTRVTEFVEAIATLDERKPRAKKAPAVAPAA